MQKLLINKKASYTLLLMYSLLFVMLYSNLGHYFYIMPSVFDLLPTFTEAPWSYIFTPFIIISSIIGFYKKSYFQALLLHPYETYRCKRLHTLFTSAFVHRNFFHLLINVIFVYGLGYDIFAIIKQEYSWNFAFKTTILLFLVMIIIPNSIQSWLKRDNFLFTSVGASGLSFALIGFSLIFYPNEKINHRIFPWIDTSADYWLYVLLVSVLASFIKKTKVNIELHIVAYLTGSFLALALRPHAILDIFNY